MIGTIEPIKIEIRGAEDDHPSGRPQHEAQNCRREKQVRDTVKIKRAIQYWLAT